MHSTDVGADDELSYTTFLFLQFPAFEVDFTSGKVFAGVLIAFLSSILNGTGMAIQGLGHLKVAHFHHLLAALKDCPGDERDRLELALSNPNTFAKYHTGEAARQEGLRRLNEMAANEGPEIKSEEEMDELIGSGGPSNWTNPTWILGFVMAASAGIANNVALAFAPAALIAPIDATVLVVNVCVSPLFLPTKLYIKDYGGATVITMGVAICVLFGPVNNKTWTSAQIMDCWAGTGIQVWTAANAAVWVFCNWRVKRSLARMQDEGTWHPEAGEQLDLTAPGVKWLGIMRCYTAALIGTYTGLFSAATFLALGNTISGVHNNFRITSSCISTSYFTLAMFIGLNIRMEISKQEAIKWFGSVFVVPIYQGFIIIGLVLTCGIFYQDFTGMLSGPIFLFSLGVLVTSSGVLWVSSQPEDEGGCGGSQRRNSKKSGFEIMEDPDDNEEEHASTPRGGVINALAAIKARSTASKLEGASLADAKANNITGTMKALCSMLSHEDGDATRDFVVRVCEGAGTQRDVQEYQLRLKEYGSEAHSCAAGLIRLLKSFIKPGLETEDSPEQCMVMAAGKSNSNKGKAIAQEQQPTECGVTALESHSTLGLALQGKKRLPKPRSTSQIDEVVWSKAVVNALTQVKEEYRISCDIGDYYSKMCQVGKTLLAEEVHRRTQASYDYHAKKLVYRENRRKTD